jgi:hypothetical protein
MLMNLLTRLSQHTSRAFCGIGRQASGFCVLLALVSQSLLLAQQSANIQDPADMEDSSGDIAGAQAAIVGEFLHLSLTVHGVAAPTIEETAEGMSNRYYYHWLIDTDNNPATGRSNSEYEGNATNLANPIGSDLVIQFGWRDGAPDGVYAYDPADDETEIVTNYSFFARGNTINAVIPLESLGLAKGQTIGFSAFQEGASNGWQVDWIESATLSLDGGSAASAQINDPADIEDANGDISSIMAAVIGDQLHLYMTAQNIAAPTVEQTLEGMNNRYYYHWLLDTDNNPATGRTNSEYEGNATNLENPIGADLVVQFGWRDGATDGVYVYDPADDETPIVSEYAFQIGGNTIGAVIPLEALGISPGQSIAVSGFQEGSSNGWQVDWAESAVLAIEGGGITTASVEDESGDLEDPSGDLSKVNAWVVGNQLRLSMTTVAWAAPTEAQTVEGMSNRYYYHWLVDTDNNPATGRTNSEYEGNATNLNSPIGADLVIQFGWRNGAPDGVYVYDPADDETPIVQNYPFVASGNTISAILNLDDLGITTGQTLGLSAFQEGASNGWQVDWVESAELPISKPNSGGAGLASARVQDVADMADSSGDISGIQATVVGDFLHLSLKVHGAAAPTVDQTVEGMSNRYYYHWLLDTDNNPATGRSNSEYEGNATNLETSIGADLVVQFGWRDGAPDGIYVYDPADDETQIVANYPYLVRGNTIEAILSLESLGLANGQTIGLSAFQEGASNGWQVDWIESAQLTLNGGGASTASVSDPADIEDANGDLSSVHAAVVGDLLYLYLTVENFAGPKVDQTAEGMSNRHYYHWLLDTDNNPATGRTNSEYEGNATNLENPIGADLVVQFGWRDGAPDGVYVYDPADDETPIVSDYAYQVGGNTTAAMIPLASLGLVSGQTIAVSAFQEGASNGWQVDWVESAVLTINGGGIASTVAGDPAGDMEDANGDLTQVSGWVAGDQLRLLMTVANWAAPNVDQTAEGMSNRHYYHWLLDTDNNPATGRTNSEYEGSATNLENPIGADLVVQFGWRDGAPDGIYIYDPADDETAVVQDYEYVASGNTISATLNLSDLGISPGETIGLSAFQEGASNGWQVDWMESAPLSISQGGGSGFDVDSLFSANGFGFTLTLTDEGDNTVNPDTILAEIGGMTVVLQVSKANGITTVTGRFPTLLEAGIVHEVSINATVGGAAQGQTFAVNVNNYSVLPEGSRGALTGDSKPGFIGTFSMVSSWQPLDVSNVHGNIASVAEQQLSGVLEDETGLGYYNEASTNFSEWVVNPVELDGVINWFEQAFENDAVLNFPNDEEWPVLSELGAPRLEGVVAEITTYLELEAGYHQLGLYSEGGHKVTATHSPDGPVLSLYDSEKNEDSVPTYYGRSQIFDIVAPRDGLYPIRILWFQSEPNQETGLMLEFYTVKDRALHLVNDVSNPKSIRAFQSAGEVQDVTPEIVISSDGANVTLEWIGMLQMSNQVDGPWEDVADDSQSPRIWSTTEAPMGYARAVAP